MADDKRTAPGDKPRRRPAPQIDLTATEVPAPEPQSEPEDAAEPVSEAPKPSPSPTPRRPSAMTYAAVAGAIIGAIVVGVGMLWFAGAPQNNAASGTELTARLAALETQIRDLAQRPAAQVDARALDALAQRIGKIEEAVTKPVPPAPADSALIARIAAI